MARSEGWKLHVSVIQERLKLAVEYVSNCAVRFNFAYKHIHPDHLSSLNSGRLGNSQIGKSITIYPISDDSIAGILDFLHPLLLDWSGPVIENEIRPIKGVPIYLRYGSFTDSFERTLLGTRSSKISNFDGQLVEDDRNSVTHVFVGRPPILDGTVFYISAKLLDSRFSIIRKLSDKGYSVTLLAYDASSSTLCTLRIAKRFACIDSLSRDAAERAELEADILNLLDGTYIAPKLIGVWNLEDAVVVCREWINGETLAKRIFRSSSSQENISEVRGQLKNIVQKITELGYMIADLSPGNLLLDSDNKLWIFDLESCIPVSSSKSARFGTFGYTSPDYFSGDLQEGEIDNYSIDAIIFALSTSIDLSAVADPDHLKRLDYYTLDENLILRSGRNPHGLNFDLNFCDKKSASIHRLGLVGASVKALAYSITSSILLKGNFSGVLPPWSATSAGVSGIRVDDMYCGSAGICYGLLRVGWAFDDYDLVSLVEVLAQEAFLRLHQEKLPGLIVGKAGIGWLFLALFQVTKNYDYVVKAKVIASALESPISSDLFHGKAGILLFLVWLYRVEKSDEIKTSALALIKELNDDCILEDDVPTWKIPTGYENLSGKSWLGLAHGTAGIVLALIEAQYTFGASPFCSISTLFFDRINFLMQESSVGNDIPDQVNGSLRSGVWCHGGGGHAWVMIRARQLGYYIPDINSIINCSLDQASKTGVSLCHGLSSAIELGLSSDMQDVMRLVENLINLHVRFDTESVTIPDAVTRETTTDFFCGAGGVISTLARVAEPQKLGYFFDDPASSFICIDPKYE